jgi:hypothetical protein
MCDATFAFGHRGGHFFQCPSRRDHTRLPPKLFNLLSSSQIVLVHHVALGFENSFLVTYRDRNGRDALESQGLPKELNDFLYAQDSQRQPLRSIPSLRLVLGAYNSSFFVSDQSSCLWMNLPLPLLKALQARIQGGLWMDKPRIIALGADQDFVLVTEKHSVAWHLPHYVSLGKTLQYVKAQEEIGEIKNITLHPYRYHSHVAFRRDGTLTFDNLPTWSTRALVDMKDPLLRDVREVDVRRRQASLATRPGLRERNSSQRESNRQLQEWARVKREWNEKRGNVERKASARGVKLSLSLNISAAGITGGFGKMLG